MLFLLVVVLSCVVWVDVLVLCFLLCVGDELVYVLCVYGVDGVVDEILLCSLVLVCLEDVECSDS